MGAVASGGVVVLNEELVSDLGIPVDLIEDAAAGEASELARRERLYRGGRGPLPVRGRFVILVDDGLATGTSMRAAIGALRERGPERIVVAVPVGAAESCDDLRDEADELVCLHSPQPFFGVGLWYEDFTQITDEEVRELLARAARELSPEPPEQRPV